MNNKLPPLARAKLAALAQQADDMDALASMTLANVKAAEAKLSRMLSALETSDSDRRSEALRADAHSLGTELTGLRAAQTERAAQRNEARKLLSAIDGWLDKMPPNARLSPVRLPELTPNGESARTACERYRNQITDLRTRIEEVRRAPLTHEETKHFVRAWVRMHADRGRPHIQVSDERADVLFENTRALVPGDRHIAAASADFLVWLFREQVTEALLREADALTLKNALSRDERAANLVTLRAALLEAERGEEAVIMRAAQEGQVIARRADASPVAVLEVEFVGAASQAA
jgi:hypothetical protein